MRSFCHARVGAFLPLLLCLALCGCQFPLLTGSLKSGVKKTTSPCVVLALPNSGPYAAVATKIKKGAQISLDGLKTVGLTPRVENINTEEPDWLTKLSTLPEECAIVGGPLQEKSYLAARKAGAMENRVFFPFMPNLQKGEEGVIAWRFFPSPQDQVDALVKFGVDDMNIRTYGAFYPNDSYGQKMTGLMEDSLAKRQISLKKASYNPSSSASWSAAVRPLINPVKVGPKATPVPQTDFEALFLPDSWKNMDMVTAGLLYNGEDRLILMGSALWEAGLAGKPVRKAAKYDLAVFPSSWDASRAPKVLKDADFWVALGFDFMNFAANLGFGVRPQRESVNAALPEAASRIRALAPINWDNAGVARQQMYIFQVGSEGMRPLNTSRLNNARVAAKERAALRIQRAYEEPEPDPAESQIVLPSEEPPRVEQAPVTPVNAPAPIIRDAPQPSYKLRLPTKR